MLAVTKIETEGTQTATWNEAIIAINHADCSPGPLLYNPIVLSHKTAPLLFAAPPTNISSSTMLTKIYYA